MSESTIIQTSEGEQTVVVETVVPVVAGEELNPVPTNPYDAPTANNSTLPSKALGRISGTSTGFANDNLAHVCDITGSLRKDVVYVSFLINEGIETIRTAIESLFASASASPFGDAIRTAVAYVQAKIKLIQKYVKKAQEAIAAVNAFIAEVNSLIAYIATLPAKIANFLRQCLLDAKNTLVQSISEGANISAISNTINYSAISTQVGLTDIQKVTAIPSPNGNSGKP